MQGYFCGIPAKNVSPESYHEKISYKPKWGISHKWFVVFKNVNAMKPKEI